MLSRQQSKLKHAVMQRAQPVTTLLSLLPAQQQQQQQPSLHPSAHSAVAAASSSSHVVDATGHQYTAQPAALKGLLPKAVSPMTDQCASGADELPGAVDAQPQHHTAGPDHQRHLLLHLPLQ
ncbi:TPA: hypothetical protein ACH3X1_010988 [Trebouxia sp. C0004]